eukprot:Gregarina_sp_Pseudo_9__4340@NODE_449_length_2812_cov_14_912730_g425_i0_p3_GENE_NODE_449_length_2812_cov_14_912730_g425_i0NODE_449_length_2812_cov_14_912730_g425_i0_p3_ORF_typecomplete_len212_score20_45COPI_assoc/PF08507_10/2_6e14TMEM72/PF16054_5/0_85_NODE_449_length_2812_cov_14_912730_g425_i09051540
MTTGYRFLGDAFDGYDQAFKRPQLDNYPATQYDDRGHAKFARNDPELRWKDIFRDLPDLHNIRQELEGPRPLRALAGLGGLALCVAASLKLLNIGTFFTEPWRYVVETYILVFGIAIMIIEAKSAVKTSNKQFLYTWFPFASIVGGKGICYIFFGTLGLSLGQGQVLLFGASAYIAVVGLIYCLIHFAKVKTLAEQYNQSVLVSQRMAFTV